MNLLPFGLGMDSEFGTKQGGHQGPESAVVTYAIGVG